MLRIDGRQMEAFARQSNTRFVDRMLSHIREHFANHWRVVGRADLARVVRFGLERAERHGIRSMRGVMMFVSVMLYLGSRFDEDLQLPWAARILADRATPGSPDQRAERLLDTALRYMDAVYGERNEHLVAALDTARHLLGQGPAAIGSLPPSARLPMLARAFPQKYSLAGETAMRALVDAGAATATAHGLRDNAGAAACTGLMFLLGQGFARDPQFPWAATFLDVSHPGSARERVEALLRGAGEQLELWLA